MYDPFDLSDEVIRDSAHVRVTRHAPESASRCTYRKQFKAGGLASADYWLERENQFLFDFAVDKLRHVVELSELKRVDDGQVSLLATFDAGVTIEDWLRVRPQYAHGESYAHPFKHAGLFLLLLKGCLSALREIHQQGIVHCDIKADNICLGHTPYPFRPQAGQTVRPNFNQVRLIDFAFSLTPKRPLQRPLPILPNAPYQSNLLRQSLMQDLKNQKKLSIQTLDWRADLYSLGHMASLIADAGLLTPAGTGGRSAYDGAFRIVEQLKKFDGGRKPSKLPHDGIIAEIDGLLEKLGDLEAYQSFEVVSIVPASAGAIGPTPQTPLALHNATPVAAGLDSVQNWPAAGKPKLELPAYLPWLGAILGVFLGLLAAFNFGYQNSKAQNAVSSTTNSANKESAPVETPVLVCPENMDREKMDAFTKQASTLWPKLSSQPVAKALWAKVFAELKNDLAFSYPSVTGPTFKSRSLNCLAAMEAAGDTGAKKVLQDFRGNYLAYRKKHAFQDWLIALDKNPASPPPEGYELWWENGKALAETGDLTAQHDQLSLSAATSAARK